MNHCFPERMGIPMAIDTVSQNYTYKDSLGKHTPRVCPCLYHGMTAILEGLVSRLSLSLQKVSHLTHLNSAYTLLLTIWLVFATSCVLYKSFFLPGSIELIGREFWRRPSANAANWCVCFERQLLAESFLKLISFSLSLFVPLFLISSCPPT